MASTRAPEVERPTIAGVATGRPDGGVAIVRVSGPRAAEIGARLIGELPPPRRLTARSIVLLDGERERGLVVWMPGPRSFTGEDVFELHVHAGEVNVRAVIDAVIDAGAIAAARGDFSRRAFELGRIGLDEAEGIAAIIGAQTDAALAQARRLAAGELGQEVEALRQSVLQLRAEIEANLDFPEDVDAADSARWRDEAREQARVTADWLVRFEAGRRAREVARIVVAGPPNAGKSSLFNALLGHARAIVADTPGTTRDYVEAPLAIGAYGAVLVDTAGLRATSEPIERAGVERSATQMQGADVIVWVEAADAPAVADGPDDRSAHVIRVESKRDRGVTRRDRIGVITADGGAPQGIDEVRDAIARWFAAGGDTAWIGLRRHRDRAAAAKVALDEAQTLLCDEAPLELVAFALAQAQARLGEITGRGSTGPIAADVLDEIFARFCIGK